MFGITLTIFLTWLSLAVILLAGLLGFVRFRGLPTARRYLAMVAWFDVLIELLSRALTTFLHKPNLILIPISLVGELGLLALAYRSVLQSGAFSRLLPWGLGAYGAYALLDTLAGWGTIHFAPGVQITADLLLLGLVGLHFQKLLNELHVKQLQREPFFWVSAGITVYALGDLQIALFSNYLLAHYSHRLQVLVIHTIRNAFVITLYASYCLALWMPPQK